MDATPMPLPPLVAAPTETGRRNAVITKLLSVAGPALRLQAPLHRNIGEVSSCGPRPPDAA